MIVVPVVYLDLLLLLLQVDMQGVGMLGMDITRAQDVQKQRAPSWRHSQRNPLSL